MVAEDGDPPETPPETPPPPARRSRRIAGSVPGGATSQKKKKKKRSKSSEKRKRGAEEKVELRKAPASGEEDAAAVAPTEDAPSAPVGGSPVTTPARAASKEKKVEDGSPKKSETKSGRNRRGRRKKRGGRSPSAGLTPSKEAANSPAASPEKEKAKTTPAEALDYGEADGGKARVRESLEVPAEEDATGEPEPEPEPEHEPEPEPEAETEVVPPSPGKKRRKKRRSRSRGDSKDSSEEKAAEDRCDAGGEVKAEAAAEAAAGSVPDPAAPGADEKKKRRRSRSRGGSTEKDEGDKGKADAEDEVEKESAATTKKPPGVPPPPSEGKKKRRRRSRSRGDSVDVSKGGVVRTAVSASQVVSLAKTQPALAPPPPQMDVTVHRLRHLSYIPRAVLRMASAPVSASPTAGGNADGGYEPSHLAVSREGGSVELLAADEKWRTVASVPGLREREADCLAWTCGRGWGETDSDSTDAGASEGASGGDAVTYSCPEHRLSERIQFLRRLFGASRDGTVFELDFGTQRQIRVLNAGGGGVFALVSLCPSCCGGGRGGKGGKGSGDGSKCGGYLAAGCEDGCVRIYSAGPPDASSSSSLSTGKEEPLQLVSTLPGAGAAVLSLAWTRPDPLGGGDGGLAGTVLYAGVADGTIRRYDCVSSSSSSIKIPGASAKSAGASLLTSGGEGFRWVPSIRISVESRGRSVPTKVWALRALPHPDARVLVSGDSLGHVQFWDGITGTLIQSFDQNAGGADVLDVAVSSNGNKVFASGVDSRVVCIERMDAPGGGGGGDREGGGGGGEGEGEGEGGAPGGRWALTQASRPHSHDVRSLAICVLRDPLGAGGVAAGAASSLEARELLCSAGVDTKLSTHIVRKFRGRRARMFYPWPSLSPLSLARTARVLALRRLDQIELHRLEGEQAPSPSSSESPPPPPPPPGGRAAREMDESKTHIGTVEIKSRYNLTCSNISDDGRLLAASDASRLMLFSLSYVDDGEKKVAVPRRVELSGEAGRACAAVKFAPADGSGGALLICATSAGPIHVLRIRWPDPDEATDVNEEGARDSAAKATAVVELEHTFTEHLPPPGSSPPRLVRPIIELAVSPDGRYLAAGRFAVGSGSVNVFSLSERAADSSGKGDGEKLVPSYSHQWSLPPTEAPHTALSFLGGGHGNVDPALAVACADNSFYLFDPDRRCLSEWSQDLGFPVRENFPGELTHRRDYPTGLAFNPRTPSKFLLGAHGFFCAVDLDLPVPERAVHFPPHHVRAARRARFDHGKRRRGRSDTGGGDEAEDGGAPADRRSDRDRAGGEGGGNGNFTVCLRYGGMLFLDFVAPDEMVVAEQPWMDVVNSLPEALERRVYGGN